ncbi:MAG TPA: c-type cytochrome [Gaiellaceae bacterium]|jgi:ubiquinol-cytochrome c reductase cytochrome c subunit
MKRLLVTGLVALALPTAAAGAGDAKLGYHLFGQYCVSCHGVAGSGIRLGRPAVAPSLQGVGALAADFYLRTGYMPLQHVGMQPHRQRVFFDEQQLQGLIAYVASLGPGPKVPKPRPERGNLSEGMKLFTDHCAGCHQVVAEGGYVTGALPPPLKEATPTQIAEAIRIGPYVMPRFSTKVLSPAQVSSIVRYVEYAKHPDDRGGWSIGHIGPIPEGLVTWFLGMTVLVASCIVIGRRLRHG